MLNNILLFHSLILVLIIQGGWALAETPSWFEKDTKASAGWSFYCRGEGKSERESEQSAQAQCSQKICYLFGVEVSAQTASKETLKDTSVTNTIIEKCPDVRVVGRVEKKKITQCEEGVCESFVFHFYPKAEYDKEYQRLNQPAVLKSFEKTIVVREGNTTFVDPAKCRQDLKNYSQVRGEIESSIQNRLSFLNSAGANCKNLDYRNIPVQTELTGLLVGTLSLRPSFLAYLMGSQVIKGGGAEKVIKEFLELEARHKSGQLQKDLAVQMIKKNFDYLFFRNSYLNDSQTPGWKLLNGSVVNESPTITEGKSCQHHAEAFLSWPKDCFDDLQVCVKDQQKNETCQVVSQLTVKFAYLNCVCTLGSKNPVSCIKALGQLIDDECPSQMTQECFKKLRKYATEAMILNNSN